MRRTFTSARLGTAHGVSAQGARHASASASISSRPLFTAASSAPRTSSSSSSSPLSSLLRVGQRASAVPSSSSTPLQRSISSLARSAPLRAPPSSSASSSPAWSTTSATYSVQHLASLAVVVAPQVAHLSTAAGGSGLTEKKEGDDEDSTSSRSRGPGTTPPPLPTTEGAPGPLVKVRQFIKKYGAVGVVTYFGLYGATLASFYGAFSSGLLFAGDVVGIIEFLHLGSVLDESSLSPKLGSFALAWIVTKFTEPVRFALTLAITPSLSRWWRGHQHKVASASKGSSSSSSSSSS